MSRGKYGIKIYPTPETQAIAAKLKRANLLPALRRALIKATNGAVPAVRAEIRSKPSHKKTRTKASLRSQVAMAIKRRIRVSGRGITVMIHSEPHGGLANLARSVEGEIPWPHPTFGHDPQQEQAPMPFFYGTLKKFDPIVRRNVEQVLREFERKLT